ncbi:hypothetical protein HDU76_010572 [Blyttiomyces sp. JEL0837]|nr:hypothetical protein HDU76_010572 [Blyttiomyces sp. JEL0837]
MEPVPTNQVNNDDNINIATESNIGSSSSSTVSLPHQVAVFPTGRFAIPISVNSDDALQLEINLQQHYGPYYEWTQPQVLEWAYARIVDADVMGVLADPAMNGYMLQHLDTNILKTKFMVDDFPLRARVLQALEYLRQSSKRIAYSQTQPPAYIGESSS